VQLPLETTARDVKRRLDAGETLQLIDVREPFEHQIAHIANSELIPMNTVPASLQEIERKSDSGTLIVFCHHGVRSLNVVNWLRQQGVEECQSMSGGIDSWSAEVDPSVPRY
jgi:rhodanese-related sulfurtransferase